MNHATLFYSTGGVPIFPFLEINGTVNTFEQKEILIHQDGNYVWWAIESRFITNKIYNETNALCINIVH